MSSQQFEALTEREQEVLVALVDGKSNQQIASQLYLSLNTVKWYNRQIYSKLGVANRQEAVARAGNLQLLEPAPNIDDIPHNLVESALPFIGRREEIETLKHLLLHESKRHVTILGAGGMGKTTLALEVGRQVLGAFTDGVYLVKLAPVSQPNDIPLAIAESLGIHQTAANYDFALQNITHFLRDKSCLLVLDNYEQLLPDGANVISHILQQTSQVSLLTTSRERLNMRSETVFNVGGMFNGAQANDDAITLFCQHMRRIEHDFEPTDEDLAHITHICQLTGGMPLALILAAAWIDVFSLEEIAVEIQGNIDFLDVNLHDIPERQQSIQAIFEATWLRLSEVEQEAFMRFSVFVGGCTRDAARAVTGATPRTLMSLINKSLIERNTETNRYEIHELLRQYADKKLNEHGVFEDAETRHAQYYLPYIANQLENLKHGRVEKFQDQFIADWDNIYKAIFSRWGWQPAQDVLLCNVILAFYIYYEDVRPIPTSTDGIDLLSQRREAYGVAFNHPAWLLTIAAFWFASVDDMTAVLDELEAYGNEKYLAFGYLRAGVLIHSLQHNNPQLENKYFEKALAIFERIEDDYWIGQTLLMGSFAIFERDGSANYQQRALVHFQRINNPIKIAHTYTELSHEIAFDDEINMVEGRLYAEHGLAAALEVGVPLQVMMARAYLSWLLTSFGEAEAIRTHAQACIAINAGYIHDVARVHPYTQLSIITSCVDEEYDTALALSHYAESLVTHPSGHVHVIATAIALVGLGQYVEGASYAKLLFDTSKGSRKIFPITILAIVLGGIGQYEDAAELIGFRDKHYPYPDDITINWSVAQAVHADIRTNLSDTAYSKVYERGARTPFDTMMTHVSTIFESLSE